MSFAAGVRTSAERCLLFDDTGIFEKPAAINLDAPCPTNKTTARSVLIGN